MDMIYLTANDRNLGEIMDLSVIVRYLGKGEVLHLDDAVRDPAYRKLALEKIRGKLPVVAGGGSLMKFFLPFWRDVPADQKLLFAGTGVCWSYGSDDPIQLPEGVAHRLSRFRGPLGPVGEGSLGFVAPPGLLFEIKKEEPAHVLSVVHPRLVCSQWQMRFAEQVAGKIGLPLIQCENRTADLRYYSGAKLIITSRLHGAVMAAGNGIPCFAVSRDHKIDWFCSEVGIQRVSLLQFKPPVLPESSVSDAAGATAADPAVAKTGVSEYLTKLRMASPAIFA